MLALWSVWFSSEHRIKGCELILWSALYPVLGCSDRAEVVDRDGLKGVEFEMLDTICERFV